MQISENVPTQTGAKKVGLSEKILGLSEIVTQIITFYNDWQKTNGFYNG